MNGTLSSTNGNDLEIFCGFLSIFKKGFPIGFLDSKKE